MDTLSLPYVFWDQFLDPKKVAFGDLKEEDFAQIKTELKHIIDLQVENRHAVCSKFWG